MPVERSNQEWILMLSDQGMRQAGALEDLRQLLLRAALYTLVTHLEELRDLDEGERMALAEDCAQEALISVLTHLNDFRGDSKFTTWAYKFGVNKALNRARLERWKQVSLDVLAENETALDRLQWNEGFSTNDTAVSSQRAEVRAVIQDVVRDELTDRQRQVITWIAFDEVPMDVVVQRLDTNRNAVYKLLHDARRKVKHRLLEDGYDVAEVYELFRP